MTLMTLMTMRRTKAAATIAMRSMMRRITNCGRSPAATNGGSRLNGRIQIGHLQLPLHMPVTAGGALILKSNYLRGAMLLLAKTINQCSSMVVMKGTSNLAGTKIGKLSAPTALVIDESWNCKKTKVANLLQEYPIGHSVIDQQFFKSHVPLWKRLLNNAL